MDVLALFACKGCATFIRGDDVKLLTDEGVRLDGQSTGFWTSFSELPNVSKINNRIILDRGAVSLKVNEIGYY